jgi:hypothetical protein
MDCGPFLSLWHWSTCGLSNILVALSLADCRVYPCLKDVDCLRNAPNSDIAEFDYAHRDFGTLSIVQGRSRNTDVN